MQTTLQIRLDRRSQLFADRLVRRKGWSKSRVVREAITLLAERYGVLSAKGVIGVGRFASGRSDQASKKTT